MDGLDLQPARRFQRTGEQGAGLAHRRIIKTGGGAALQFGQGLNEGVLVHNGPKAEPVIETPLHFGSGRLGIGHAQDGRRLGPRQQQPRHAVDQGLGLARTGIGGDEAMAGRISGDGLAIGSSAGPRPHSSPSPPAVDHSNTRARWP